MSGIEGTPPRESNQLLAAAGQRVAEAEAKAEAAALAKETARRERTQQTREAIEDLIEIVGRLFDQIEQSSESVKRSTQNISLGPAHLSFHSTNAHTSTGRPVFDNGWDILAYSALTLSCEQSQPSWGGDRRYTFSASLVYAKTQTDGEYRWREVSFWAFNSDNSSTPFALYPDDREFGVALSNVAGMTSVAHGPLSIDAEDEDAFQERWVRLFAKAASGMFKYPNQMPPPPQFFT